MFHTCFYYVISFIPVCNPTAEQTVPAGWKSLRWQNTDRLSCFWRWGVLASRPGYCCRESLEHPERFHTDYWSLLIFALFYYRTLTPENWSRCGGVLLQWKQTEADSPRGVDPDDADVAEKNTLLVFLVLARAAFLPPVGRVGELRRGALLRRGARDGEGGGWKAQEEEVVRNLLLI